MDNWMALPYGLSLSILGTIAWAPTVTATVPPEPELPLPSALETPRPESETEGETEGETGPGESSTAIVHGPAVKADVLAGDEGLAQDKEPPAEALTLDNDPALAVDPPAEDMSPEDGTVAGDETMAVEAPPLEALPAPGMSPAERSQVFVQAAYLQQGSEGSARLRGGGIYVLSPSVLGGITADLSTGEAFGSGGQTSLSLNELYLTASPAHTPELRLTAGLMDLTSYFDRNSFAKDSLTHFFNPVFQTNPALSAANLSSRPGALVNWTPVDQVSLTATTFSSQRDISRFALDSFAGEVGVRWGNAIVRGTYATSRDSGQGSGFEEIFAVDRGDGEFGPRQGDRETGVGLNAEAFIPGLNLGLFGRYGWYTNETLGSSGQTYSLGVNGLDVLMAGDRLGLGYGRQLSNPSLRQASGNPVPDVWELFYDAPVLDNLRAGVSVQQRNAWTETYLGFRLRYDLVWNPLGRVAE
jgi:hypothetical protein